MTKSDLLSPVAGQTVEPCILPLPRRADLKRAAA
nr:MAG TPA: hypothetical protein [Bacteriophage sp.]